MQTATKTNTVIVRFTNGDSRKVETNKTIPEIREEVVIGKGFYLTGGTTQIRVENLTIY